MVRQVKHLYSLVKSGDLRERIEEHFGNWGYTVSRHAWLIIILMLLVSGGLCSQLGRVVIDTSTEGFLHDNDPVRLRYSAFKEQFRSDNIINIAVETDEVFDAEFLRQFRALHDELEQQVPYLNDINSLINARETRGEGDELIVGDFLQTWPKTTAALLERKKAALANPAYVGNMLSADSTMAVILLKNDVYVDAVDESGLLDGFDAELDGFDTPLGDNKEYQHLGGKEDLEIHLAIREIIEKYDRPGFRIYAMGGSFGTALFMNLVKDEMSRFTLLAIAIIAVLLAVIFRRVAIVFLPLTVSILAMLSSIAVMAMMDIKLSFSMQIVPSFLLAVGVGNSVHLFTVFFQAMDKGESKEQALAYALKHSGLAILMTALTTAGGLLSFMSSSIKPIAEFGMITPLGVMFALVYSLVLLPALITVFPMRVVKKPQGNDTLLKRMLIKCGNFAVSYPKIIVSTWLACVALSLVLASNIGFSFFPYKNLPEAHFLRASLEKIDDKLKGIAPLEIIIDTGREDGIKDPEILNAIAEIYHYRDELDVNGIKVGNSVSVIDVVKELHQALNENQSEYYRIPDDKSLVSQELLLFENSGADDLEVLVDSQFSQARVTMKMSMVDGVHYPPLVEAVEEKLAETLKDKASFYVTGIVDLTFSIFVELSYSLASTYIIAFMIVTPLMILLIGSLKIGLVSMLPNLAPIIITLGMMSVMGIELTTATLLTGSIALGLVVDDTIHFMHNFQRYYRRSLDVRQAVSETLATTGQALFFTTVVLSAAFFIFTMNTLADWAAFGLVTGFCIIMAFLADVVLAPALMALLVKHKVKI